MRRKPFCWLIIQWLSLFTISNTWGATYPLHICYQRLQGFPSLQQKLGSTVAIAPFQDKRPDREYIGHYTSARRVSNYFKSDPFPLERAIRDSLSQAFSRSGVKTLPVSEWCGEQKSIKNIQGDSILTTEIRRFWTEGTASRFNTRVITSVYLVIHLGVKKEGQVFTRNIFVGKERTVQQVTPEEVELTFNLILANIIDNFLSDPYNMSCPPRRGNL